MMDKHTFFLLFSLILSSTLISTNLATGLTNTTIGAKKIKITVNEKKVVAPHNFTFGDWQQELWDSFMHKVDIYDSTEGGYSDFDPYLIASLSLRLYDKYLRDGIIRLYLPQALKWFKVVHNGSINYFTSNTSHAIKLLPNVIDLFYQAKQLMSDIELYTPLSFNETLEYGLNTFFVRDINNRICVNNFVAINTSNFIVDGMLYLVEMHSHGDQIMELLAEKVWTLLENSSYENNWIAAAKASIAAIKLGAASNNNTLKSEGYTKLDQLFEKPYYLDDNDVSAIKLKIAEYLLNYNISYAKAIVDYVSSLIFHTPYGLEPIIGSRRYIHGVFIGPFVGTFAIKFLEVFAELAEKTGDDHYMSILKEILRYYFSTLYYDRKGHRYLDAFRTKYIVYNFDHINYIFITDDFRLQSKLIYLLGLFNSSDTIVDNDAPTSELYYLVGTKKSFSIAKEIYIKIDGDTTITPVENRELFLKVELSDGYGIGLKNSALYINNTKLCPDEPLYLGGNWDYLEFVHDSLGIKNDTDSFNYFLVIPFDHINSEKQYKIESFDKYHNAIYVDIKIFPVQETNASTAGGYLLYVLSLIVVAPILSSIYRKRKGKT